MRARRGGSCWRERTFFHSFFFKEEKGRGGGEGEGGKEKDCRRRNFEAKEKEPQDSPAQAW